MSFSRERDFKNSFFQKFVMSKYIITKKNIIISKLIRSLKKTIWGSIRKLTPEIKSNWSLQKTNFPFFKLKKRTKFSQRKWRTISRAKISALGITRSKSYLSIAFLIKTAVQNYWIILSSSKKPAWTLNKTLSITKLRTW